MDDALINRDIYTVADYLKSDMMTTRSFSIDDYNPKNQRRESSIQYVDFHFSRHEDGSRLEIKFRRNGGAEAGTFEINNIISMKRDDKGSLIRYYVTCRAADDGVGSIDSEYEVEITINLS